MTWRRLASGMQAIPTSQMMQDMGTSRSAKQILNDVDAVRKQTDDSGKSKTWQAAL